MMKRLLSVIVIGTVVFAADAADAEKYTLGIPGASVVRATSVAGQNAWLVSNPCFSPVAIMSTNHMVGVSREEVVGAAKFSLADYEGGFAIERTKPEYYVGDTLKPPDGVNWGATYDAYVSGNSQGFLFDPEGRCVYVTQGGMLEFNWVMQNGETNKYSYVASGSCQGRPKRIFWTDRPYNAPAVNLSGKFVKFFGPDELVNPLRGTMTNEVAGTVQVISNSIVRGVYLDPSTKLLNACGRVEGQFVMAYYDSGNYDSILHVQVIEVSRPDVVIGKGEIGKALKPVGSGFNTAGLQARVTMAQPTDDRGDYLYLHKGQYSSSPKNGEVYPLRPTVGERWNSEIYWMEADPMLVMWPFEVVQYENDWPEDAMVFLRGDVAGTDGAIDYGRSIFVPGGYGATLMKYQEPEGHALPIGNDGEFKTQGAGYSLVQLTTSDNIWFMPVKSVMRSDTNLFTLQSANWDVGSELKLRGGSASGLSDGIKIDCVNETESAGYLYKAASGSHYNAGLYKEPSANGNSDVAASAEQSEGGDSKSYDSVIYAVNTQDKPLEVWWNTVFNKGDMPSQIEVPSLPQVYDICWPQELECANIVIASSAGSANKSLCGKNAALYLDNDASNARLCTRRYFSPVFGGTLTFWLSKDDDVELDNTVKNILMLTCNDTPAFTADMSKINGTNKVYFSYSDSDLHDPSAVASVNFDLESTASFAGWYGFAVKFGKDGISITTKNVAGAEVVKVLTEDKPQILSGDAGIVLGKFNDSYLCRAGVSVGEIALWGKEKEENWEDLLLNSLTGEEEWLTGLYSFRDEDLNLSSAGDTQRVFFEKTFWEACTAYGCMKEAPGPVALGEGVIYADEGTTPNVYRQNDKTLPGYNPNEEHAFVRAGNGGHVVWALRDDLNSAETSEPGVLVEYVCDGRKRMRYYPVVVTNVFYPRFGGDAVAGLQLPGPHPLDYFDNPWKQETYWDEPFETSPAHRDRKGQLWAKCAGDLHARMFYPMQNGFDFPMLAKNKQPAIGTAVPWLVRTENPVADVLNGQPLAWHWSVSWPASVPEMPIGMTLTEATRNLPQVWNMKSLGVVWPAEDAARTSTVTLFDPTVAQVTGDSDYASVPELVNYFGFRIGKGGDMMLKKGRYYFDGLPPNLSDRFYIDTTADVGACVKLEGKKESNPGGTELLMVNLLTKKERDALKDLLKTDDNAKRVKWESIIDNLAVKPVVPNTHDTVSREGRKDDFEKVVHYSPRDHYAIFSAGATNYVTLIENDATNEVMRVSDGDPIQMHVFKVVPEYYTGRIVTREDPVNLLSQMLSVIYAEAFAGCADNYEFQWKKCLPPSNGEVPRDFDNWQSRFPDTPALTRFVIGEQGDTLANMVNTYYSMRYRALPDTPARAVMGDEWSDWVNPPALAEGWVQRVLNNVTPFTQRMRDLMENEAENSVTMIRQAGAPYEGDVALNQDNLKEVGLIQLYETVLNKAESMSLSLGTNDEAANKQLQLAVGRLGDLYTVLGDEAWADALNPTIGFGKGENPSFYDTLSCSLFCFDNQVQSLLDEELALLRGRDGENAPDVTMSPFYNRLIWNFTKGITRGEVAYALNYNIGTSAYDSSDSTPRTAIDAAQAAEMFPQGHGDAYGHYLSALSGYYRLLRNPYFSWGIPAMGEMIVADNVVNVDYFDEATFAKAAYNVAKVALEVVDKTARKAYRDNGGKCGSGYVDKKSDRNFGYGEWASRGAYGAFANWMVANSLVPGESKGEEYMRFSLGGEGNIVNMVLPQTEWLNSGIDGEWRQDFEVALTGETQQLVAENEDGRLEITIEPADEDGVRNVSFIGYEAIATNIVYETWTHYYFTQDVLDLLENDYDDDEYDDDEYYDDEYYDDEFADYEYEEYDDEDDAFYDLINCEEYMVCNGASNICYVFVGTADIPPEETFTGLEFNPTNVVPVEGWVHYDEFDYDSFEDEYVEYEKLGEKNGRIVIDEGKFKFVENGASVHGDDEHGMSIKFEAEGLNRIDRSTIKELEGLAMVGNSIQVKVDEMDMGNNPLGLADGAMAFDITPVGLENGNQTHFEQIYSRAETAISNAKRILAKANQYGNRLRMIEEQQQSRQDSLDKTELAYKNKLITYFGYPYSDDIGAGGTYPQGYDGPDIYNYLWCQVLA